MTTRHDAAASMTRRRAMQGAGMAGLAAALGARPARAAEARLRWWSTAVGAGPARGLQVPDRGFRGRQSRHQGGLRADLGRDLSGAAGRRLRQRPGARHRHPPAVLRGRELLRQGPGRAVRRRDQGDRPGEVSTRAPTGSTRPRDGHFTGTGIGNTAADNLWVRKDLMQKAGIDKVPETWDELRAAARRCRAAASTACRCPSAATARPRCRHRRFIHGAGGQIFTPDLQVAIDSEATANALEFYKSMREFARPAPPAIAGARCITAFVSGATATGYYAGRVLANVNSQNPAIADEITCVLYPTISSDVPKTDVQRLPQRLHSEGRARTWRRRRNSRPSCSSRRATSSSSSRRPATSCRC